MTDESAIWSVRQFSKLLAGVLLGHSIDIGEYVMAVILLVIFVWICKQERLKW
jgi:hypothetical protein